MGGPRSADWMPESFAIHPDGQVQFDDGQERELGKGLIQGLPAAQPSEPQKSPDFRGRVFAGAVAGWGVLQAAGPVRVKHTLPDRVRSGSWRNQLW